MFRAGSLPMFILMVYDVEVKRIVKVLKIGRKYLHHIQNSVLEGELSSAQYKKLKHEVGEAINPERDSVRFYVLRTAKYRTSRSWVSLLVPATPRSFCKSTWSSAQTTIVRQKQKSCKWCKIPSNGSQSRPRLPPFKFAEVPANRYIGGWFAAYLRGFETCKRVSRTLQDP